MVSTLMAGRYSTSWPAARAAFLMMLSRFGRFSAGDYQEPMPPPSSITLSTPSARAACRQPTQFTG